MDGSIFSRLCCLILLTGCHDRLAAQENAQTQTGFRVGQSIDIGTVEETIVESLCRMGLFDSAVARCRAGAESSKAGRIEQARWTASQLSAMTQRDAQQAQSIADAMQQARQIAIAFVSKASHQRYANWVRYSFEAARFRLANRSVAAYLAAPTNPLLRDDALATVRDILTQLIPLREAIENERGVALRQTDREAANRVADCTSLLHRLSLLAIDCHLLRSDCYAPKSDERIAAGTEALSAIEDLLARIDAQWNGRESIELARLQSLLALNRFSEIHRLVASLRTSFSNPAIRNQALAISIRSKILEGDLSDARRLLDANYQAASTESPEMALAQLELQIAEWRKSADATSDQPPTNTAQQSEMERLLLLKDAIGTRFGSYWNMRAEAIIVALSHLSGATSGRPTSLELLKVEVRQAIAAGDIYRAIDRLEVAESSALNANDRMQAFGFAKVAIGLLQTQKDLDLSTETVIVERVAEVARKYSDLDTAAALHASAIERVKGLVEKQPQDLATTSDGLFVQLLKEHIMLWPMDVHSADHQKLLQQLYLNWADLKALHELWTDAVRMLVAESEDDSVASIQSRLASAQWSALSARLLETLYRDPMLTKKSEPIGVSITQLQQWLYDAVDADFSHWTIDGGLRRSDDSSVNWSQTFVPTPSDSAIEPIRMLLLTAKADPSTSPAPSVDACIAWANEDKIGRIGWLASLTRTLSTMLCVRVATVSADPVSREWVEAVSSLHRDYQSSMKEVRSVFHPSLQKSLGEHDALIEAQVLMLKGDSDTAMSILDRLRESEPRNPRWLLEASRLKELGSATMIESALAGYRQLAAGSAVGSDRWFEARVSAARCLGKLDRTQEANDALALVEAMAPSLSEKWKRRIRISR